MSPTYILLFLHSFISFTDSDSTNDLKELNWINIVIGVGVSLVVLIIVIVGINFFIKKRRYCNGQPHFSAVLSF